MIYQMEVGEYPFDEANEYLIFERIKAVDVKYPLNMDPDAKDIVQRILVREPEKRLGAGPKGSPNDFDALKTHPFFEGVDFATLHETKPPIYDISSPYKKKRNASGDEDDLIMNQMYNYNLMDRVEKAEKKAEATKQQQQQHSLQIILSGLVLMKDGWFFYKARKLVLNNEPRLSYFDPETGQKKGEIPLVKETKAVTDSSSTSKFSIQTPKGNYTFKEVEHSAQRWCDLINETIKIIYEKK